MKTTELIKELLKLTAATVFIGAAVFFFLLPGHAPVSSISGHASVSSITDLAIVLT